MEYITTKEASAKWGISTIRITVLANEGRIPGAKKLGRSWMIPAGATKPTELKANHSEPVQKEPDNFSFPLSYFRPDWNYSNETQLTAHQQLLLQAETAVVECRFEDAYSISSGVLHETMDIATEIGFLFIAGICCVTLNKPDEFPGFFLRLKMLLSKDFSHRDDLAIIFDFLNTYVDTIISSANNTDYKIDVHDQSLPMTCMLIGYNHLIKEAIISGSADVTMLELLLRFLNTTHATFTVEMLHIYLLGIYSLRQNTIKADKHAELAVQIAYENKIYYPLVTYYRYNALILSPIIDRYPKDFQKHIYKQAFQYDENFAAFLTSISEHSVFSKLSNADFPYIYAVLLGLSNADIAKKNEISQQTVKRRIEKICEKCGVSNKKDLREYLQKYM